MILQVVLLGFLNIIISILDCIQYLLIGYIILGWIMFFGVIKNKDSILLKIYIFLMTKIEPMLSKIRKIVPPIMGFDFSPMVIFFCIYIANILIRQIALILLS